MKKGLDIAGRMMLGRSVKALILAAIPGGDYHPYTVYFVFEFKY